MYRKEIITALTRLNVTSAEYKQTLKDASDLELVSAWAKAERKQRSLPATRNCGSGGRERKKMRESLFRGKGIDDGKWLYGYFLYDDISNVAAIVTYVNLGGNVCDLSEINIFQIIPETAGQYIGMTDMNGKKIFDGDIIKFTYASKSIVAIIKYDEFYAGFVAYVSEYLTLIFGADIDIKDVHGEVIGNIHDNTKLIREN